MCVQSLDAKVSYMHIVSLALIVIHSLCGSIHQTNNSLPACIYMVQSLLIHIHVAVVVDTNTLFEWEHMNMCTMCTYVANRHSILMMCITVYRFGSHVTQGMVYRIR